MPTEHVLILGGDLEDAKTLGIMTQSRVDEALAYARLHPEARFYAAAGVCKDFLAMQEPMAKLIAQEALRQGLIVRVIGPDTDFNTRGELRVFRRHLPMHTHLSVVSTWWHLPRVKRIVSLEWGKEVSRRWNYIPVSGKLTVRLCFLEAIKWVLTFAPERLRATMVGGYRKLFGRSSW